MSGITLEDIFASDDLGLLNKKPGEDTSAPLLDEDRLETKFEEINAYVDKYGAEPSDDGGMIAISLAAILRAIRSNERSKRHLKVMDRHNLLGVVEMNDLEQSLEDLLESDTLGLLDPDHERNNWDILDVSKLPDVPAPRRGKTDFVAQREPIEEADFVPYEALFRQVHQEIKSGEREIIDFTSPDQNLKEGRYYVANGLLCLLEQCKASYGTQSYPSGQNPRLDGRLRVVFENGTSSNMLFRSFSKLLFKDGKMVTEPLSTLYSEGIFGKSVSGEESPNTVSEEDMQSGRIYVLRSLHPDLKDMPAAYKIGVTSQDVSKRIANAKKEPTYLYSDVEVVATYLCYNLVASKLEILLHRFFSAACLDMELRDPNGLRIHPREWFVVPLGAIDQAISLTMGGTLHLYRYDTETQQIIRK